VAESLKNEGLYDSTWIIFTSDHGDMAGAHGFLSKGSYMYDEICRIPLLVRPPEGVGGRRYSREPVTLMDITATCIHVLSGQAREEICGRKLHGDSLVPLLRDNADWQRSVHYAEYHGDWYGHYSARMVTDGRWKLVWNLSDLCELYDLQSDPFELVNRFYDEDCRQVRGMLFDVLRSEAERLGDGHIRLFDAEIESRPDLFDRGPLARE
jgi:arylsulfatase A-like enzyme